MLHQVVNAMWHCNSVLIQASTLRCQVESHYGVHIQRTQHAELHAHCNQAQLLPITV